MKSAAIVTVTAGAARGAQPGSRRFFSDARDRARRAGELQALADRQLRAGRFPAAWTALSQAAAAIEEGSSLSKLVGRGEPQRQAGAHGARRPGHGLAPALAAAGREPAGLDLRSAGAGPDHRRGRRHREPARRTCSRTWDGRPPIARLARARATPFPPSPNPSTAAPSKPIPANPHAHAHWGHWLAVQRTLAEANTQFEAALASGRARPYVRAVQLAALLLAGHPAFDTAYIAAVADMVRNREPVDAAVRDRVYTLYAFTGSSPTRVSRELTAAVPAAGADRARPHALHRRRRSAPRPHRGRVLLARAPAGSGGRQRGRARVMAVGAVVSAAGGVGPAGRPGPRRGCGRPPGSVTLIDVLITFISVTPARLRPDVNGFASPGQYLMARPPGGRLGGR